MPTENTPPSSSSSSNSKTVRFNVGGKIYDVSRSLLEQHPNTMLSRLASNTWCFGSQLHGREEEEEDGKEAKKDNNKNNKNKKHSKSSSCNSLFIERNGDRFQYCLDYMRDGGIVNLPPTVPKEALLQDLLYYGFDNLDPSCISVQLSSIDLYEACRERIDSFLRELRDEQLLLELAQFCIGYYRKHATRIIEIPTGELLSTARKIDWNMVTPLPHGYENHHHANVCQNRRKFNAILERIGLKLERFHGLKKLELSYLCPSWKRPKKPSRATVLPGGFQPNGSFFSQFVSNATSLGPPSSR